MHRATREKGRMVKIAIVMDGGIIHNVVASEDVSVSVIDYDIESIDSIESRQQELIDIPQIGGGTSKAYCFGVAIEVDVEEADRLTALVK
jgi:hypothetical protein